MNLDCNGVPTGSYIVTGAGGNSTDYNFSNGMTTNTDGVFTMLAAGNYIVTISEQANPMCASVCNVAITEPESLTCVATLNADVSCNGLSDGSATVVAAGGTALYTYAWDNGETTATATMLNAATHTVTVTDANGCATICEVIVSENPPVTCTATVDAHVSCNGASDGSLVIGATGGDGVYEYDLDGTLLQTFGVFGGLPAGSYTLTLSDANGCSSTCTATITEPAVLSCSTVTSTAVSYTHLTLPTTPYV